MAGLKHIKFGAYPLAFTKHPVQWHKVEAAHEEDGRETTGVLDSRFAKGIELVCDPENGVNKRHIICCNS